MGGFNQKWLLFSLSLLHTHTGRSGCKGIEIKLAVAAEVDPKWMVVEEHVGEEVDEHEEKQKKGWKSLNSVKVAVPTMFVTTPPDPVASGAAPPPPTQTECGRWLLAGWKRDHKGILLLLAVLNLNASSANNALAGNQFPSNNLTQSPINFSMARHPPIEYASCAVCVCSED